MAYSGNLNKEGDKTVICMFCYFNYEIFQKFH